MPIPTIPTESAAVPSIPLDQGRVHRRPSSVRHRAPIATGPAHTGPARRRPIDRLLIGAAGLLVALAGCSLPGPEPSASRRGDGGEATSPVDRDGDSAGRPPVGSVVAGVALTERHRITVTPDVPTVVEFEQAPPTVVLVPTPSSSSSSSSSLSLRYRSDGRWGEWVELDDLDHEAPDGLEPGSEGWSTGSPAYGPVWLDGRSDAIEFSISAGGPVGVELLALDPSRTESDRPSPAGPAVVSAALNAPVIQDRNRWAGAGWAAGNGGCGSGPSRADNVAAAVVHHTVTGNSYRRDQVDDVLRSIYYTHVVVNGWCDVGYNFVVDRFGGVWEARTGSRNAAVIGGHAKGFNTSTVGVALLGQHQSGASPASASPSTAAARAVQDLLHWRLGQYGVDPAGMTWLRNHASSPPLKLKGEAWHRVPTILGHRDLGLTSCPGDLGHSVVRSLPSALVARRDLALPYRFERWTARRHGPGFLVGDAGGGLRPAGSASQLAAAGGGPVAPSRVVAVDGRPGGGYQLTSTGKLVPFGQAPSVAKPTGWPAGGAAPVDVEVRSGGGGWVLDTSGRIAAFGGARAVSPVPVPVPAVALALDDDGSGYVLDRSGRLHAVGSAAGNPVPVVDQPIPTGTRAVDLAVLGRSADTIGGAGGPRGWVLDSRGTVRGFGGAGTVTVNGSVQPVAVAVARGEPGGWVVDSTGSFWSFGGARLIRPVSTDVSRANVVDAAQLGLVADARFLNSPDARYLLVLYQRLNGRKANPAEISRGVAQLEDGEDRLAITDRLARSPGWAGVSIDTMYRDVLGRAPDAGGRRYWLQQIANGMRYEDLGVYFYGSAEYAASAGGDRAYVTNLYRVLLGRRAEPAGLDYWVGQLARPGVGPPTVAHSFYRSIESRRDRVDDLYRRILGRTPKAEERDYWARQLLAIDDVELASELAASAELYRSAVEG